MSHTMIARGDAASLLLLRRVRSLSTVDQWRLLVSAVLVFLLLDVIRLAVVRPVPLPNSALIATMDVMSYLALIVALWRPVLGLSLAIAPLGTALFWTSSSLDAVLLTAVSALVVAQVTVRQGVWVSVGLVGYVGLRAVAYTGGNRIGLVLTLGVAVLIGLVLGWVGHAVRDRVQRASRSALERAMEENRIRVDERRDLAADLHDVVVHHLSTASLHLLAVQEDTSPAMLRRVLKTVEHANREALTELRLLAQVLRADTGTAASGTEVRDLSRWLPPTLAGAEGHLALVRAGLEPDVRVPAAADLLELTVQRTLSRLVQEAIANQVAHAPPGARCSVDIEVSEHQVTMRAANAVAADGGKATLGWGLLGLRERVTLTGGTFRAAVDGLDWVLAATLPRE